MSDHPETLSEDLINMRNAIANAVSDFEDRHPHLIARECVIGQLKSLYSLLCCEHSIAVLSESKKKQITPPQGGERKVGNDI